MRTSSVLKRFYSGLISAVLLFIITVVLAEIPGKAELNDVDILNKDQVIINEVDDGSAGDDFFSKDLTRGCTLGLLIPSTLFLGIKSWDWGESNNPKVADEGWFGRDTVFGGADKAGHFFAHYALQRVTYSIFDWTESGDDRKWAYSLGSSLAVGMFIEIGDSFSDYGLSVEDIVMDCTGILTGAMLDYSPILDGFFGFSVEYVPTKGFIAKADNNDLVKSYVDFVNDYSGWQYMLNFKIAGFRNLGFDVPLILRLLSVDVGWYTKGYSVNDTGKYSIPKEEWERNLFVGISINSAQVVAEMWPSEYRNKGYKVIHTTLQYYHLPYERLPVPTRYVRDLNE
ncbi:MAG: hypothetical protein CVV49_05360 [Spirochaetae bacterium HGW-Spirochaetae-5]|nr:MAG: hypothetical protein CVV49_05360 [Spirochaetae bacterium HGW-Spirochaetae-5]